MNKSIQVMSRYNAAIPRWRFVGELPSWPMVFEWLAGRCDAPSIRIRPSSTNYATIYVDWTGAR